MRLWMPLQIQVLQLLFFFHWKPLFKITYLELEQVYSFDSARSIDALFSEFSLVSIRLGLIQPYLNGYVKTRSLIE